MAITITANDANDDSTGIDVAAYLADFDATYASQGFGYFSTDPGDFSGSQFANTEQTNLIADVTKQSVVFDAGGGANSIDYDFATHRVGGDVDEVSFGYGITYDSGTDSFPFTQLDLRISGLGLVDQFGEDNPVHSLLNDAINGNVTTLGLMLAANEIIFVGSTGADVFTGFSHNDTATGGGGNDTFTGGDGDDTAIYSGNRADYTVTNNGDGTWTVTDNRVGDNDGTDTLTGFESAQFLDQTVELVDDGTPVASDDAGVTLKNHGRAINVLSNDTDSDGTLDLTSVAIADGPDHGAVVVNPTTGVITYTPTAGYFGTDSFTYTVEDNDGNVSNTATVNFDVVETYLLTAGDDVFSGDSFGWTTAGIVVDGLGGHDYIVTSKKQAARNDTINGGEGNDLIFVGGGDDIVDGGAGDDVIHGRASTAGVGDLLTGGEGNDTFVIRFTDAGKTTIIDTDGALWHGTFRPASFPPSWTPAPSATSGFGISGTATVVSAGVWDLAVLDQTSATVHLTLNWTGDDLTITRSGNPQNVVIQDYVNGTFGITLDNGAPVASDDTGVTLKNHARTINVLSNDTDFDGTLNATTVAIADGPDHGAVTVNPNTGVITYTPTAGYFGVDSFTYTVTDNDGAVSNTATVNFDVVETYLLTAGDDVFSGDSLGWTTAGIVVDGLGGHDYIVTSNQAARNDTINGGEGNDLIFVGGGDDIVDGGAGDDVIHGRASTAGVGDVLTGGEGNDTFVIRFTDAGKTTIIDTDGALWHGTFRPTSFPPAWTPAPSPTSGFGISGAATVVSAGVWDLAVLDQTAQTIHLTLSYTGDDLTITRSGNPQNVVIQDYVNGTFGITLENVTTGDADNNTFFGGAGIDTLIGGVGNDTLVGNNDIFQSVPDVLNGGDGDDVIYAEASDIIIGGAGRDVVLVVNSNPFTINLGATSIEYVASEFGNDTIDGSTLSVGFEAYTDGGNDTITGSAFNDFIWSGSGDDTVTGGDGNDVIIADIGADNIQGGGGDDVIYADNADTISGGDGRDALFITDSGGPAGMTIDLAATGFEYVRDLTNGGGDDTLDGANTTANLEIYAQAGTDIVTGGSGNDFMWGGSGNDVITGNDGDDTLVGEVGSDTLAGGLGIDALFGNSGNGGDLVLDTFVFDDNWGTDFVFDFDDGIDKIDLSAVEGIDDISDLVITTDGAHAHIRFDGNLISVANMAGQIDAGDFLF